MMAWPFLPFDLQTALAEPERVVTQDGRKIAFLAHDPGAELWCRLIIRLEGEKHCDLAWEDGTNNNATSSRKLFLLPKTRTMYLNVRRLIPDGKLSADIFDSLESANDNVKEHHYKLIAFPIEVPE